MLAASEGTARRLVKGSHVVIAAEWIDGRLGEGTARQLGSEFGVDWGIILPVGRYDVDSLIRVLEVVSARVGMSVEDITAEIARLNALRDLTSIYRAFLRFAQPVRVLGQTPRLWTTYVSYASARAIRNEPGSYLGEGYGFEQRDLDWACGCWRGFIPCAIELAGGKDVQSRIVRRERMSDGHFRLELECLYR